MNPNDLRAHLDELEQRGRLEKLLAKDDDPSLSLADMAFVLQLFAFLGLVLHIALMANTASETKQSPPPVEFLWFVLLALVAAALLYGGKLLRNRRERLLPRLRQRGQVVPAALVMVNDAWFEAGNTGWWPGYVLISFDPRASSEPQALQAAAKSLFGLRKQDRRQLPADQVELAWAVYHEMGPAPTLPVPTSLCGGLRDCWLASVQVPPTPLRDDPLLLALALPGEASADGVRVLPAAVLSEHPK